MLVGPNPAFVYINLYQLYQLGTGGFGGLGTTTGLAANQGMAGIGGV